MHSMKGYISSNLISYKTFFRNNRSEKKGFKTSQKWTISKIQEQSVPGHFKEQVIERTGRSSSISNFEETTHSSSLKERKDL